MLKKLEKHEHKIKKIKENKNTLVAHIQSIDLQSSNLDDQDKIQSLELEIYENER